MNFFSKSEIPENIEPSQDSKVTRKIIAGATAIMMGAIPLSAEDTQDNNEYIYQPDKKIEADSGKEDLMLHKINLRKEEIKPEYLQKYLEGKYKAIVIVDLKTQRLSAYDKNGNPIIKEAEVSTGRKGMETPKMSHESGKRELIHVNKEDVDMPYCVPVGPTDKTYIGIHEGGLPGFPASHGCIRTLKETAKTIYDLNTHEHDLVIVVR